MIEGTMANMIAGMLKNGVMDFYDELLNLLYLFTCVHVSQTMWCILPIIYEMFQEDGSDFFNGQWLLCHIIYSVICSYAPVATQCIYYLFILCQIYHPCKFLAPYASWFLIYDHKYFHEKLAQLQLQITVLRW